MEHHGADFNFSQKATTGPFLWCVRPHGGDSSLVLAGGPSVFCADLRGHSCSYPIEVVIYH